MFFPASFDAAQLVDIDLGTRTLKARWRYFPDLRPTAELLASDEGRGVREVLREFRRAAEQAFSRWLDRQIDELEKLRALLTETGEESETRIEEWFTKARDARAEWATQEGKSGDLLQSTSDEMNEDMKSSFGRLFFGNLASRKRKLPGLNTPTDRRP